MAVTVTGAEGTLKWGYRHAATLRAWTITKDEHGVWSLTGTLTDVDDFAMSQPSLKFVTPNDWRWPIEGELQIADAACSARLGPKETVHGTRKVC